MLSPSFILRFFPFIALLFSTIALAYPGFFVGFKQSIIPLLMLIMLGMGLTLQWQDFAQVLKQKKAVLTGVFIQYTIMPFAAFVISLVLGLSLELTIGMMLVGSTAGGTASNVVAYLAKGDLALSVSMTLVSTLFAIVLLPFLTWVYIGQMVPVPVWDMLINLLKLILLPILIGISINSFFPKTIIKITPILPLVSMFSIIFIIAIIVALNQQNLATVGFSIIAAIVIHNMIGLGSAYWLCKLLKYPEITARTIAIEVGMQNSGLSVALALKYFTISSALPGALFSIWHNISGSFLAAYWRDKT